MFLLNFDYDNSLQPLITIPCHTLKLAFTNRFLYANLYILLNSNNFFACLAPNTTPRKIKKINLKFSFLFSLFGKNLVYILIKRGYNLNNYCIDLTYSIFLFCFCILMIMFLFEEKIIIINKRLRMNGIIIACLYIYSRYLKSS